MTKVIAELGVAHLGDIKKAERMIDAASAAKCWGVKLQVRDPATCFSREKLDSYYESPFGTKYRDWAYAREFEVNQHIHLKCYANALDLKYGFSVWDRVGCSDYSCIEPDFVKLPSAKIRDMDLLKHTLYHYKKSEFHLSTGGCELADVDKIVTRRLEILNEFNVFSTSVDMSILIPIVLYHCVMSYPMNSGDACLSLMSFYRDRYQGIPVEIGYSDHSPGLHVPFAAALLGAKYIEKHICLSRSDWGPDNASSLEPHTLAQMVRNINSIPDMLGDGVKRIRECERKDVDRLVNKV